MYLGTNVSPNINLMKHITLCKCLQVSAMIRWNIYCWVHKWLNTFFIYYQRGAHSGWKFKCSWFSNLKKVLVSSAAFHWVFSVYFFWHANQWASKALIWIPHMWAFDRNLNQDPLGKSIKGNSLWNIQSYASVGASGPRHSFCLAIPMWQSKWISMTILFLKRLGAARFIDEFQ